jgi:hypothetical protein
VAGCNGIAGENAAGGVSPPELPGDFRSGEGISIVGIIELTGTSFAAATGGASNTVSCAGEAAGGFAAA